MRLLQDQVAIITGASRGIGEAVSRRLAQMGAHVVLCARDKQRLEAVRQAIADSGGSAETASLDLASEPAIAALGADLRARHRRCDILVNNAAIGYDSGPLHQMDPADWNRLMATNLRAPYLMIRAVAPLMIERGAGHIVNISSLAGHYPLKNGAAYSASKWGLNGLTYSVAEELREHGVRVSVVAPGSVNTEFGGHRLPNAETKIQPDDVADVVAMLVTQRPQSFVSEVLIRPTKKA